MPTGKARPLSIALLQAPPLGLLRSAAGDARRWRVGGLAGVLPTRRCRGERARDRHGAGHSVTARDTPKRDREASWLCCRQWPSRARIFVRAADHLRERGEGTDRHNVSRCQQSRRATGEDWHSCRDHRSGAQSTLPLRRLCGSLRRSRSGWKPVRKPQPTAPAAPVAGHLDRRQPRGDLAEQDHARVDRGRRPSCSSSVDSAAHVNQLGASGLLLWTSLRARRLDPLNSQFSLRSPPFSTDRHVRSEPFVQPEPDAVQLLRR